MAEEYDSSTVIDTEFDIVEELKSAVDDIEKDLQGQPKLLAKTDYLKFLLKELDDSLTGEYESLRRKRFITKKSER
jgi:hypothetical protein